MTTPHTPEDPQTAPLPPTPEQAVAAEPPTEPLGAAPAPAPAPAPEEEPAATQEMPDATVTIPEQDGPDAATAEMPEPAATAEMPTHDAPTGTPEPRSGDTATEGSAPAGAPVRPPRREGPSAVPPVWTAASTRLPDPDDLPEPPARRVRVGQLIWAGVVIILGVYLLILATVTHLDFGALLIGLVALLGVGLIVAALFTGRKKPSPATPPN